MAEPVQPDPFDPSPDAMLRLVADSVPALLAYDPIGTLACRFDNRRMQRYGAA